MKKYWISERALLKNVIAYNCLILMMFGLFIAFLSSAFDEKIRFFGSVVFAIAIGVALFLIYSSSRILANKIEEKKKKLPIWKV